MTTEKTWAEQWQEATKTRKCFICDQTGNGHHFIMCSECDEAFHKVCLDPLRTTPWDKEYVCDICSCFCQTCELDDIDDKLLMCDYCSEGYHIYCLEPPLEEIPPEDEQWFCPNCEDAIDSDEEWEKEHVVDDDDVEGWTRSECKCNICIEMNQSNDTWNDFVPSTGIERCLKNAIDDMFNSR